MQFATLSVVAASDNQGMIKSLSDRMSYSKVYPNSTLRPDWDLLEEIVAVYRHIGLHDIQFEWVKGHQDDSTLHHELTPQARFNIRSDKLASTITQSQGIHLMPQTPLLPSTRCHLEINGATITGKYRYHLRLSASEPPLFDYLAQRHKWDSNVLDSIDWEAFCMAARTYSSTEVHLLKLVHDKLPLRRHVSRHQCWTSDQCHYCSELDTMDHLQTAICNTVSIEFRATIRTSIKKYLSRRQCPPAFITRFLSTVQSWFDPAYPASSPTSPLPEQTMIGLRLMTRGFLSLRWRQDLVTSLHHSNGGHTPTDHEITSTLAGLIKVMWNAVGQLWLDHLATIHETTKSTQSPITLESLRSRVRLIHALRPHTLPIHAHYFPSNLDGFLQKATIQSLTSYITHYLPPIEHSINTARSAAASAIETRPECPTPAPQSPTSGVGTSPSSTPSPLINLSVHPPTSHPAMEETPHRKRNRRRRFTRVLQALTTWARRRRMSTTAT